MTPKTHYRETKNGEWKSTETPVCVCVSPKGEVPIYLKDRVKIKARDGLVYKGQIVNAQRYCLWIRAKRFESPIPIIFNRIKEIEKIPD